MKKPCKNHSQPLHAAFPAACREVRTDADGARWFQTFPPYGRYPVGGTIPGAKPGAEFVFDEASARAVIASFEEDARRPDWPGVLVDREHFSTDPGKTSDAMAWARGIRQDDDGSIWTRWEFTPAGARLWEDKVLVSRSPYFLNEADAGGMEYRPTRLVSIAMTNTPHFRNLSTLAAARAAEVSQNKENNMDKILEALGLQPDASEEEVLGAIAALKDKASAQAAAAEEAMNDKNKAEKERDEAVAECRGLKADAFIREHADKIADAAACREVYVKDPALAEKMVAACRGAEPAKPAQQVLASARTTPDAKRDGVMERLASCRSAEERCSFVMAHAKEIAEASK